MSMRLKPKNKIIFLARLFITERKFLGEKAVNFELVEYMVKFYYE